MFTGELKGGARFRARKAGVNLHRVWASAWDGSLSYFLKIYFLILIMYKCTWVCVHVYGGGAPGGQRQQVPWSWSYSELTSMCCEQLTHLPRPCS